MKLHRPSRWSGYPDSRLSLHGSFVDVDVDVDVNVDVDVDEFVDDHAYDNVDGSELAGMAEPIKVAVRNSLLAVLQQAGGHENPEDNEGEPQEPVEVPRPGPRQDRGQEARLAVVHEPLPVEAGAEE
jgi:hypothetical protein